MEAHAGWSVVLKQTAQHGHDSVAMRRFLTCRFRRFILLAAVLLVSMGARQRTANFVVETADPAFAQQAAQAAERFRHDLAVEWLGKPMPNWAQPCVMTIQVGDRLGAGGATTFIFDQGEVFNWRMSIQGSGERVLDSVLPHEITHMIFASHFRQPLPRWADEGGATSVEHASERNKHRQMLPTFLRSGRGIAFNQMVAMMDYPRDFMPLYAQGYSVSEFLIQTGGRRKFVDFLGDGLKGDDWNSAVERHYGVKGLAALQNTWLAWVRQGSPLSQPGETSPAAGILLAATGGRPRPEPNLIYRIRDKESPAVLTAPLTPVHIPSSRPTTLPALASNNIPRSEPVVLPASGWRVAGSSSGVEAAVATTSTTPAPVDSVYSTQAAHPQPIEPPSQTILR